MSWVRRRIPTPALPAPWLVLAALAEGGSSLGQHGVGGPAAHRSEDIADTLRSKLGSGVVVIGTRGDGNVNLVVAVTKDLTGRVKAGEVVKRLSAIVGGGGGGRPDFAQAGGKDPEKLPDALAAVQEAVREQLNK